MTVTIYHNPRCSKSRETLKLLQENNVEPVIVEYLKTPLSAEQISLLCKQLGMETPRDLMRKKETDYKENNLADESLTEQQLLDAMVSFPKLIERPIVVVGEQAKIGRPPEAVLAILPK